MTWTAKEGMSEQQIQKELNKQMVLFEQSCKNGQITTAVKFETLAEKWLENHAKLNLRHTTYSRYLQLRPRIYPKFGHLRMDRINTRLIQKFITDLAVNGKNQRTGEPLKRKSLQHHLIFISGVFQYAIRLGMLTDNPCERVVLPNEEKPEKDIYTIGEIEQIFEKLQEDETKPLLRMFVFLAVYSGFRRGELLGLEWRDLDWNNSVISVRRTSNYSTIKGTYTDTTKTKKSQRSSQLPTIIMDMLKKYKSEQDAEREKMGDQWEESGRIFTNWCGKPLCTTLPYKWFKQFCEKHGFRFLDLHSMRHPYVKYATQNFLIFLEPRFLR